jgi:hypothetical protein
MINSLDATFEKRDIEDLRILFLQLFEHCSTRQTARNFLLLKVEVSDKNWRS